MNAVEQPRPPGAAPAAAPAANPEHHRRPFPIHQLLDYGGRALNAYNRAIARFSTHGAHALFEPAAFPWIPLVEAQWRAIRAELDEVLSHPEDIPLFADVSPDQVHLTAYGKWKTFFFMAYGVRVEDNCRRCPETVRILRNIPGLQTAFFSILEPHVHIAPHSGPYGGVLRYHLALKVPEPRAGCRLRVADRVASWEEGRSLVFDDTYEHEAWNDTNGQRVVLFVDFERPLPPPLREVNRALIALIARTPFVQEGIERYEQWKARRR